MHGFAGRATPLKSATYRTAPRMAPQTPKMCTTTLLSSAIICRMLRVPIRRRLAAKRNPSKICDAMAGLFAFSPCPLASRPRRATEQPAPPDRGRTVDGREGTHPLHLLLYLIGHACSRQRSSKPHALAKQIHQFGVERREHLGSSGQWQYTSPEYAKAPEGAFHL